MRGTPIGLLASVFWVLLAYRIAVRRRANAAMRARQHLRMLCRIAELTELSCGNVASLVGATADDVSRWHSTGIPVATQREIAELLRVALALRREFAPSTRAQLLTLRRRQATEREWLDRFATTAMALSGRLSYRHAIVNTRQ